MKKKKPEKLGITKRSALDLRLLDKINGLAARRVIGIDVWLNSELNAEEKIIRIKPLVVELEGLLSMYSSVELYGIRQLLDNMEKLITDKNPPSIIHRDLPMLKEAVHEMWLPRN